MKRLLGLLALLWLLAPDAGAVSSRIQGAVQARLDASYALIIFADGTRSLVPLSSLTDEDRSWLATLSAAKPVAHGNTVVTVVAPAARPAKKTIVTATTVGPLETVQLCPPSVARDQIGGTCMLYGRVHWLDIAGYYVANATIYKISAVPDQDNPWKDPRYLKGLVDLLTSFTPRPAIHDLPSQADPFDWARGELRKGRPILGAFPREIWQALPPGFIAAHPWNGGSVGHQIVINGFTWNKETQQGTFHIINSWKELPEFDLQTEAAQGGALVIEQSLSAQGEPPETTVKETVKTITFLRTAGKTNLYEVQTNLGTRKIAAPSEDVARSLIEDAP